MLGGTPRLDGFEQAAQKFVLRCGVISPHRSQTRGLGFKAQRCSLPARRPIALLTLWCPSRLAGRRRFDSGWVHKSLGNHSSTEERPAHWRTDRACALRECGTQISLSDGVDPTATLASCSR
jgi:hypothetical protein